MGNPSHYSQELPERCMHLIQELLPLASKISLPGQESLGPLTTTFLLAMAMPIITLPIERVERHRGKAIAGFFNDRPLSKELTAKIDEALGGAKLSKSPFYHHGHWRFSMIEYSSENISVQFPNELSDRLSLPDAMEAASKMPASEWASCLRNALAHGGVVYLDENGHSHFGSKTEKLAFVSARYIDGDTSKPPSHLKVLQIDENAFFSFLQRWVNWVSSSGLSAALAA